MVVRGFRAPWTNLQQNTAHISVIIRNYSANAFTCSQNMPKWYHDNLRKAHQSIQFGDTTVYTRWYFSHSTSGGLSRGWACLFRRLKSSWVRYGSRLPTCYYLLIRPIPPVCETSATCFNSPRLSLYVQKGPPSVQNVGVDGRTCDWVEDLHEYIEPQHEWKQKSKCKERGQLCNLNMQRIQLIEITVQHRHGQIFGLE